jgi:hypothetical protein
VWVILGSNMGRLIVCGVNLPGAKQVSVRYFLFPVLIVFCVKFVMVFECASITNFRQV